MDPNAIDPKALLDFGTEVAKTAPDFFERLGPVIGMLYKPIDIIRTAKAQARAQIIQAEANLAIPKISKPCNEVSA